MRGTFKTDTLTTALREFSHKRPGAAAHVKQCPCLGISGHHHRSHELSISHSLIVELAHHEWIVD